MLLSTPFLSSCPPSSGLSQTKQYKEIKEINYPAIAFKCSRDRKHGLPVINQKLERIKLNGKGISKNKMEKNYNRAKPASLD